MSDMQPREGRRTGPPAAEGTPPPPHGLQGAGAPAARRPPFSKAPAAGACLQPSLLVFFRSATRAEGKPHHRRLHLGGTFRPVNFVTRERPLSKRWCKRCLSWLGGAPTWAPTTPGQVTVRRGRQGQHAAEQRGAHCCRGRRKTEGFLEELAFERPGRSGDERAWAWRPRGKVCGWSACVTAQVTRGNGHRLTFTWCSIL